VSEPNARLLRRVQGRRLAGVASGIADHLGISATRVRIAFVVLGSFGAVLYSVCWIVLPPREEVDPSPAMVRRSRVVIALILIVGSAVTGLVWTATQADVLAPATVALIGGALIWRQATDAQRSHWWRMSRLSLMSTARHARLRLIAGIALVLVGGSLVLPWDNLSAVRDGLLAVVVTIVGMALITGPWWVGLITELSAERAERIRAQEREEIAAKVHDSVLQTLALIQRNSGAPREVTRLARGQERELRALLYGGHDTSGNFAEGIRVAAAEIEDSYGVNVDSVVVGDAPMSPSMNAVVGACREAMQNAAKHSHASSVSVYVEVEPTAVVAYVRDRGVGFVLDEIADDRQGVRGSIIGRVERHGGDVSVSSAPTGTEVRIRMPR